MKQEAAFKTEADLCAAFIAWAKPQGWVAYAETAGWDILLVDGAGIQLGIQAKLKFNMQVLHQAVEESWHDEGPDFRGILIPKASGASRLLRALGLGEIYYSKHYRGGDFYGMESHFQGWHFCNPIKRHKLPEYVPDVPAGVPSPSPLSHWKIAALKIVATLNVRGFVTRADFREAGIDPGRWMYAGDWLKRGDVPGQWVKDQLPDFAASHPVVYPQVLAAVRAEMQKRGKLTLEPT